MSTTTKVGLDDFIKAHGPEALQRQMARAEPYGTQRPTAQRGGEPLGDNPTTQREPNESPVVPLGVGSGGQAPPEPFPTGVLPRKLRAFVLSVATALPCPADYIAVLMLVVLATLIGRKACISPKSGWVEYAVLWVLLVARSGDRKSPAFNIAFAPLRWLQRKLREQYQNELDEWNALPPDERKDKPKPKLKQILTTSFTIEGLHAALANSPSVCAMVDEAVGVMRALGQYKGGKGDDRQQLLSLWSSEDVVKLRAGADPIAITYPHVCFGGCAQPEVAGEVVTDPHGEDGGGARFLTSYPHPLPPAEWTEDAIRDEDATAYREVCERLWEMEAADEPLGLDPQAKAVWVRWVNEHRREEPPDHLKPFWSKLEGYCLRLMLVLFLAREACEETGAAQVDAEAAAGAVKLVNYFKSHARRVHRVANDRGDRGRLGAALRWIAKQGGTATARKLRMYGVGGVKSALEAEELLNDLAEHGHGTLTEEARDSKVFRLNATVAGEEGGEG